MRLATFADQSGRPSFGIVRGGTGHRRRGGRVLRHEYNAVRHRRRFHSERHGRIRHGVDRNVSGGIDTGDV